MALFDVSAAFDSVGHDILLRRLSITFWINELPLAWINSYLSERSDTVLFHSSRSRWHPTPFGLPQESVFGPVFYILFTADIGPLLASCSLSSHSYADDIQAYKHCLASQAHSAIRIVSHATATLNAWMSSNRLLLNPLKSQYIWFGTRQQLDKLDLAALSLEFPTFVFSTSFRCNRPEYTPGRIIPGYLWPRPIYTPGVNYGLGQFIPPQAIIYPEV